MATIRGGIDGGIYRKGKRRDLRDRFGEAHQPIPSAPRPQLLDQRQTGRWRRQSRGIRPTVESQCLQAPKNHDAEYRRNRDQRRRECGISAHGNQALKNVATATARVISAVLDVLRDADDVEKEEPRLRVDSQKFRTWSQHDHQTDPRFEAVRTGAEMKLATNPRRISRASSSLAPTSAVSVAAAVTSSPDRRPARSDPAACRPGSPPWGRATLSTIDEPSRRKSPIGMTRVYRPTATGKPATVE